MREAASIPRASMCRLDTWTRRVLVPTDFSEASDVALGYAVAMVERCGAALHLLHVIEEIGGLDPLQPPIAERSGIARAIEASVWEDLRRHVSEDEQRRLDLTLALAWGLPLVEILRYAHAHEIDLIAMGSNGRGAIRHILIGTVAESVVRGAHCAVLTVRGSAHERAAAHR